MSGRKSLEEDSVFDRDERRLTVCLRRSLGGMAEPGNSGVAAHLYDYHRPTQRVGRGNTHSNACYSTNGELKKINLMKPQPTNTPETREPTKNHQILLSSRPSGEPLQDNFKLAETEIPKPGPGQILLRTIYLSLDPYMRGRMNAGQSYAPRVEIGEVMSGESVCQVIESNVPNYSPGDIVLAATP